MRRVRLSAPHFAWDSPAPIGDSGPQPQSKPAWCSDPESQDDCGDRWSRRTTGTGRSGGRVPRGGARIAGPRRSAHWDSRAAGQMSLDLPDRVGQERGGLLVDAGLAPDRVDEPRAQLLKGRAVGTGE